MAGEKPRDLVDGPERAGIQGPYSVAAVPRPHLPFGSLPNAQLILLGPLLCLFTWDGSRSQDKAGKKGPFSGHPIAWIKQGWSVSVGDRY